MKYPKVKICDVRDPEIARFCLKNGVDFIGLHQIYSPISDDKISLFKTIKAASVDMPIVLVTKIDDIEYLTYIIDSISFDYVQLHFDTDVSFIKALKQHVRKTCNRDVGIIAVFQADSCDFSRVQQVGGVADYLLFDSHYKGGTGVPISDESFASIVENCSHFNYFIAGGLNPDNVQSVISKSHPFALDVQTGVESERKIKDPQKIKSFVDAVHSYPQ